MEMDDAHTRAERLYIRSHSKVTRFLALVWLKYEEWEPVPPCEEIVP